MAAMPKGFITRESSKWKLNYAVDNLNIFLKSIDSLINVTKNVFQNNVIPEDTLDSAKRNFDLGARRYVSYKVSLRPEFWSWCVTFVCEICREVVGL